MPRNMRARKLSEKQLDDLAELTFEDIEDARLAWEADAPPAYKGLLDAEVVNVEVEE